jgi:hypothetical protein
MKTTRYVSAPLAGGAFLAAAPAHAGPTAARDLNLGTATGVDIPRPALGAIGVSLRAGWCFDVGRYVFLLPELGIEYDVERGAVAGAETTTADGHVSRFFVGARAGVSKPVHPILRIEPALFGHGGVGWYAIGVDARTFDVGLSLGLRIKDRFLVGAQLGYNVVGSSDAWVSYGVHGGVRFW